MKTTDDRIRAAILEHMREQQVTRADLARQLGVTHQAVSNVLSGRSGFIPKSLENIITALGLQLVILPTPEKHDAADG